MKNKYGITAILTICVFLVWVVHASSAVYDGEENNTPPSVNVFFSILQQMGLPIENTTNAIGCFYNKLSIKDSKGSFVNFNVTQGFIKRGFKLTKELKHDGSSITTQIYEHSDSRWFIMWYDTETEYSCLKDWHDKHK